MNRWVKRALIGVGGLLGLGAAGFGVFVFGLHPKKVPAADLSAPKSQAEIERGQYLAEHVALCVHCHSESDHAAAGAPITGPKGGGSVFLEHPDLGRVTAPNITPDKEHGIGAWTDGEIVRAIREGISRDGHALVPMMPYEEFRQTLTQADALAIVAYLRTLKPASSSPAPTALKFPLNVIVRMLPEPVENEPAAQAQDGSQARGKWLLRAGVCAGCHSAEHDTEDPQMFLRGGGKLGDGIVVPNITSDPAAGIGSYSDEDILRAVTKGVSKSGAPLRRMPSSAFAGMTEDDQKALLRALRAVPPLPPAPADD